MIKSISKLIFFFQKLLQKRFGGAYRKHQQQLTEDSEDRQLTTQMYWGIDFRNERRTRNCFVFSGLILQDNPRIAAAKLIQAFLKGAD